MVLKFKYNTKLENYPSFSAAKPPDRKLPNPSFVAPTDSMSFAYTRPSMNVTPRH